MVPAARINDLTAHGQPLMPGPGSITVLIGAMPAWRALPSAMADAVEDMSNTVNRLMIRPQLTPADAAADVGMISKSLTSGAAKAAGNGAPEAAAVAAGMVATINATNVALTTTWSAASVVPGGQPAANIAYTEGLKAVVAAAACAVFTSMARLSDMHTCSIPVPLPPHGPGFVTRGSSTVKIDGLPAARVGDQVFEACGGSAPIAMGFPTVLIG